MIIISNSRWRPTETMRNRVCRRKKSFWNASSTCQEKSGRERIVWRYDPILVSKKIHSGFPFSDVRKVFWKTRNHAEKCVISFLDMWQEHPEERRVFGIERNHCFESEEIAASLSKIAGKYGLGLECCSRAPWFQPFFDSESKMHWRELIARISGKELAFPKDKNQRKECGCASKRWHRRVQYLFAQLPLLLCELQSESCFKQYKKTWSGFSLIVGKIISN